jgi:hypothetical protein
VGNINGRLRRLEALEVRYGVGTGQFTPHKGDERELVTREALRHLTSVELKVLGDLMELRARHPDMNGAEFFAQMSDIHRAMEREWVCVVRGVLRDRIEESNETRKRKAELQRRADEAIRMGMLPEEELSR